jgi:hypothetical protein
MHQSLINRATGGDASTMLLRLPLTFAQHRDAGAVHQKMQARRWEAMCRYAGKRDVSLAYKSRRYLQGNERLYEILFMHDYIRVAYRQ